jgi:serine phosphatase RsbU (regulator of sigma subunit)/DNA-binding NarL/FixJ family response regulator
VGVAMGSSHPIRVMIVDDHTMVRRGLATILKVRPNLQLVGEASNGLEALERCELVRPDVILMDLVMPVMDGTAATQVIREKFPESQVLVLTSFKEKDLVEGALAAGAIGYLLKNVSAEELTEAIQAAHAGRSTMAPEVTEWLDQVGALETLGRAILNAPPDASALPQLLREHIPALLPDCQIEIRLFPEQIAVRHPLASLPVPDIVWQWLRSAADAQTFLPGAALPWGGALPGGLSLLVAPVVGLERSQPLGAIYVQRRCDPGTINDLVPVVKSLAAQIASALQGAQIYAQTVANKRVARELAMAGQIQASFLPQELPEIENWQLAAALEPARETAGDFYDLILLPGGSLGIVIADVADKGMGAALFMALCRTLVRTYALEHPAQPDLVLRAVNRRMLADTRADLFVTIFYGILDPKTGTLVYCNAGHNPPFLFGARDPQGAVALRKTGMALGVLDRETWQQETVHVGPGQVLLLYTDGVIEAQDPEAKFFGTQRLLDLGAALSGAAGQTTASDILAALMAELRAFAGDAPQFDDITLIVVVRDT